MQTQSLPTRIKGGNCDTDLQVGRGEADGSDDRTPENDDRTHVVTLQERQAGRQLAQLETANNTSVKTDE